MHYYTYMRILSCVAQENIAARAFVVERERNVILCSIN